VLCLPLCPAAAPLRSCAQRNYRTFLLFIYSTSVYIAWTFGVCLGSLFVKHAELQAAAAARGPQDSTDTLTGNPWLQTLGESECTWGMHISTWGMHTLSLTLTFKPSTAQKGRLGSLHQMPGERAGHVADPKAEP
jgi:hypothetical protein